MRRLSLSSTYSYMRVYPPFWRGEVLFQPHRDEQQRRGMPLDMVAIELACMIHARPISVLPRTRARLRRSSTDIDARAREVSHAFCVDSIAGTLIARHGELRGVAR